MQRPAVSIRHPLDPSEWRAIRDICCQAGETGVPIEPERAAFFAELHVGQYQAVLPEWTYVAEASSRIVGYLTGCPDTVAFRRSCRFSFVLPLLLEVARGRFAWNADVRRFVAQALLRTPPRHGLMPDRAAVEAAYPAHSHMNVESSARGTGVGRKLMDTYLADLRERGVPGIHIICPRQARDTFVKLGFEELRASETRHAMLLVRRLSGGAATRDDTPTSPTHPRAGDSPVSARP